MRNRIIQVRHYSRKMMIMMLTGAICCSSCFCETAFAKTSKVRVYDVEKGTTGFTSFTYSDNKKDESLAPSEGAEAISSASQKVVIFHQADGQFHFSLLSLLLFQTSSVPPLSYTQMILLQLHPFHIPEEEFSA